MLSEPRKDRRQWVWTPPVLGCLKVNANGFFMERSGRGGVGGLIRESEKNILIQFCKEVRVDSTLHAEVLALSEGLIVVEASHWASFHFFVFKSDSQIVIV